MTGCETNDIGPVAICVATREMALAMAVAMIDRVRASGEGPRILGFCNAHTVNLARRDPRFAAALREMLVLNDGAGVDISRRLLYGAPFPANLNGTDLTPAILGAAPRPWRVFLLGSPPGIAERAAERLSALFPQHAFVGTHDGFFDGSQGAAIAQGIAALDVDVVLAGMGQPRQEHWAVAHGRAGGAAVLCIGAYLDFVAGAVSRAPKLVRATRMEWAYRLALEPQRLARRYLLGNPLFLRDVLRDAWAKRQARR